MLGGVTVRPALQHLRHRSLRARLVLWISLLLFACSLTLTVFLYVSTTLMTAEPVLITTCGAKPNPVGRVSTIQQCITQNEAPYMRRPPINIQTVLYAVAHIQSTWFLGLGVATVVGALSIYWLVGRALRPIRIAGQTANLIDIHSLNTRLNLEGANDDVTRFAEAFDTMLARLEGSVERERRFVGDASHELRTPLAVMRVNLEVVQNDPSATLDDYHLMSQTLERSLARLDRLVDDLLLLARGDGSLHATEVDLGALVKEVVASMNPLAERREIALSYSVGEDLMICGEEALLMRAIANVLENAVHYNRPGGRAYVHAGRAAGLAIVKIMDTGPGIAVEDQPHIFERFWRAETSRSRRQGGAGLGLALALEIAQRHGGTLALESEPGAGSAFTFSLPLLSMPLETPPPM